MVGDEKSKRGRLWRRYSIEMDLDRRRSNSMFGQEITILGRVNSTVR